MLRPHIASCQAFDDDFEHSPPAMFRSIEKFQPTLIIDEADAPTAYVIRTVGDDHEPKKFTTWAFKAIAGIGTRAATIEDRSIGVALKRKLPDEKVERLRYAFAMQRWRSSKRWRENSPAGRWTMPLRSPQRGPPCQSP